MIQGCAIMNIEKFELLQDKILQKLNEDLQLLEAEKYNDGMSSSTQTFDSKKNIENILSASKKAAELEKVKARDAYRNIKSNPNTSQKTINLVKRNYEKSVSDYKKADLKKSNFKYATELQDNYSMEDIVSELDNDLNEASANDIAFANAEITRINNKISDLKSDTKEQKDAIETNMKNYNKTASQDKDEKLNQLKLQLEKQKEETDEKNNKKIEQLEQNKETKLDTLERRLNKLKYAKDNIKAQLSANKNNKSNNTSGDETMSEEYENFLSEKASIEEGIINAVRKLKLKHQDEALSNIQKKLGAIDVKIAALKSKLSSTTNEKKIAKINATIDKLTIKKSKLEELQQKHSDKYTDLQTKIKEEIDFNEIDELLTESDNLLKEIADDESKLLEQKNNIIPQNIKTLMEQDSNSVYLKPIILKINEEANKENPDMQKLTSLIIKYGNMRNS